MRLPPRGCQSGIVVRVCVCIVVRRSGEWDTSGESVRRRGEKSTPIKERERARERERRERERERAEERERGERERRERVLCTYSAFP